MPVFTMPPQSYIQRGQSTWNHQATAPTSPPSAGERRTSAAGRGCNQWPNLLAYWPTGVPMPQRSMSLRDGLHWCTALAGVVFSYPHKSLALVLNTCDKTTARGCYLLLMSSYNISVYITLHAYCPTRPPRAVRFSVCRQAAPPVEIQALSTEETPPQYPDLPDHRFCSAVVGGSQRSRPLNSLT